MFLEPRPLLLVLVFVVACSFMKLEKIMSYNIRRFLYWSLLALTTPLCVAQVAELPNMTMLCFQACLIQSSTNPTAIYQYGDPINNVWGNQFTVTTFPMLINYTNQAALGVVNWTSTNYPTTAYAQQTTTAYTVNLTDALGANPWTVTIPALPPPPAVPIRNFSFSVTVNGLTIACSYPVNPTPNNSLTCAAVLPANMN
jgi:hypothetical protein